MRIASAVVSPSAPVRAKSTPRLRKYATTERAPDSMATRARAETTAERIPAGACVVRFAVQGRACPWTPSRVTKNGTFKPARVRAWQAVVKLHAQLAMAGRPAYAGAVRVVLAVEFTKGPLADWDNLSTAVVASCQGVVIVNDRMVEAAQVTRSLTGRDRVEISVYAL